jgi:hypothetical protein
MSTRTVSAGPRLRAALVLTLFLGGLGLAPCRVAAGSEESESGSFEEVIRSAAAAVLKLVKDQPVAVGQITPTGLPDANGGPAIAELLRKELESLRAGSVRRTAPFEVKGDFVLAPHPDKAEAALGQKIVRVIFRVVDTATGEENNLRLIRFIRDNTSIIRLLGISGPLSLPEGNQVEARRKRNEDIQRLVPDPKTIIDPKNPSLVGTSAASPYRVEILAGPKGDGSTRPTEAKPARLENGLAFVNVDRGEVYEIRIHNASPEEAAVRVFIDGLDVFHFSNDRKPDDSTKPKFSHFIVPPARGGTPSVETIPGWHKSLEAKPNFLAFLVTAYGEGASSKAGAAAQGPVGVVQVQFSRCHTRLPGGRSRSPSNETGFGPPRDIEQKAVEREIEPPTDVVSIRYTR